MVEIDFGERFLQLDEVLLMASSRDLAPGSVSKCLSSFSHAYSAQNAQVESFLSIAHILISHFLDPENNRPDGDVQPSQSEMS
jgi:hypothetical protein